MASKNSFPCNSCDLTFNDSPAQRTHMRGPWHVYNLKRRMASLPAISAEAYAENIATSFVSRKQDLPDAGLSSAKPNAERQPGSSGEAQRPIEEQVPINRCLFCPQDSENPQDNFKHMSTEHGIYLPEIEHLSSLEAIVGYLRTVINEYHECLYCGTTKSSPEAARRHMLDKGHCMINLEREPELLEFWELSDDDGHDSDEEARPPGFEVRRGVSDGEYALPSGKIVGSKGKARDARLAQRAPLTQRMSSHKTSERASIDKVDGSSPSDTSRTREATHSAVIARTAAGIVGLSDQQMRSLATIERKVQRQQAIVRASEAWADEKGGRSQKHGKVKMNLRAG